MFWLKQNAKQFQNCFKIVLKLFCVSFISLCGQYNADQDSFPLVQVQPAEWSNAGRADGDETRGSGFAVRHVEGREIHACRRSQAQPRSQTNFLIVPLRKGKGSPRQWHRDEFESGGHKNFSGRAPPLFFALKAQLVVSVSAFMMVRIVCSVSCLLFFYSRCPPCPVICKSGGARAPVPYGVCATGPRVWSTLVWTRHPARRRG